MAEVRTCGPLCQHPACWSSGRTDMIEAFQRMSLARDGAELHRNKVNHKDNSLPNNHGIVLENGNDSLPTLKVINLFESEDDEGEGTGQQDSVYFPVNFTPKEKSILLASAATRSSKQPQAPNVSPSSFASQYFLKQKRFNQGIEYQNIYQNNVEKNNSNAQTTCITLQEVEDTKSTATFVPYLIWVPSKKSRRKKLDKSYAENVSRSMEYPKVHTKNITGNDSEFGYLTTPFNKESSIKCYSRAAHAVRSSPSKLQPRRLPPISREATEKSRSSRKNHDAVEINDLRLSGDGFLTSMRLHPGLITPQNTQASMYTRARPEDWDPECPDKPQEAAEKEDSEEGICIVDKGTLIIERHTGTNDLANTVHNKIDFNDSCNAQKVTKESREEMTLPTVTVPEAKLKKLPIENHCRNSIPCHYLSDIQMQPIHGNDTPIINHSSGSIEEEIEAADTAEKIKYITERLSEEVNRSDTVHETVLDYCVNVKEVPFFQCGDNDLQMAAPTASSLAKRANAAVYGDMALIELIKQEQNRTVSNESCSDDSQSIGRRSSHASKASKPGSLLGSPVPSQSSSNDWPSDKDIMRQTYERYRSFTPFKTPGVSLIDTRLTSIKEASREHTLLTGKEKSLLTPRTHQRDAAARIMPDYFQLESRLHETPGNKRKKIASQVPLPLRSISVRRKSHVDNISEINVSTMTPRQRKIRSRFLTLGYGPRKEPFTVAKFPLQDPTTKLEHGYVPSYEIYEALTSSRNMPIATNESIHVVTPAASLDAVSVGIHTSKLNLNTDDVIVKDVDDVTVTVSEVNNNVKNERCVSNDSVATAADRFDVVAERSTGDILVSATDDRSNTVNDVDDVVIIDERKEDADQNKQEFRFGDDDCNRTNKSDFISCQEGYNTHDQEFHNSDGGFKEGQRLASSSDISRTDLSRKPGITSKAENSDDLDDSDTEHMINSETGLNFLSFNSNLDFSLNLEDLKKEIDES